MSRKRWFMLGTTLLLILSQVAFGRALPASAQHGVNWVNLEDVCHWGHLERGTVFDWSDWSAGQIAFAGEAKMNAVAQWNTWYSISGDDGHIHAPADVGNQYRWTIDLLTATGKHHIDVLTSPTIDPDNVYVVAYRHEAPYDFDGAHGCAAFQMPTPVWNSFLAYLIH